MSDYEGSWTEQEGRGRGRRSRYRSYGRSRELSEAERQAAEEKKCEDNEEHKRVTSTQIVGFMIDNTQRERAPIPASIRVPGKVVKAEPSFLTPNRKNIKKTVASVNIELARDVERLERELAHEQSCRAILWGTNNIVASHIMALRKQVAAGTAVTADDLDVDKLSIVADVGSTLGGRHEYGG